MRGPDSLMPPAWTPKCRPWSPSWSRPTRVLGSKRRCRPWRPRTTRSSPSSSSPPARTGRTRSPNGSAGSCPTPSCATCPGARVRARPPTRRSTWWRGRPSSCSATTTSRSTPTPSHRLVEESFRSNAGVVSPKFVELGRPDASCCTSGMSCDKTGAVVDRILDGEVDHGQHDAVRDVFVAPGRVHPGHGPTCGASCRASTPGSSPWARTSISRGGARWPGPAVVVAPDARVRHREAVAGGLEPLAGRRGERRAASRDLQMLQRRHELRAVLKCYTAVPPRPGPARRRRCWPWARSSWRSWPATATGCGPWRERGDGTPGG